jgi:hypothetical protein
MMRVNLSLTAKGIRVSEQETQNMIFEGTISEARSFLDFLENNERHKRKIDARTKFKAIILRLLKFSY